MFGVLMLCAEVRSNPLAPLARHVLRPARRYLSRAATGRPHWTIDVLFGVIYFSVYVLGIFDIFYIMVELPRLERLCAEPPVGQPAGGDGNTVAPAPASAAGAASDADATTPSAGEAAYFAAQKLREQGRHEETLRSLRAAWMVLEPHTWSAHYDVATRAALELGTMCSMLSRRAPLLQRFGLYRPFRHLLRGRGDAAAAAERRSYSAEAEAALRPALHACRNLLGVTHPRSVECAFELATALQRRALEGGGDEAAECALEAAALAWGTADSLVATLRAEHPRARSARVLARRIEHLHAVETIPRVISLYFWVFVVMLVATLLFGLLQGSEASPGGRADRSVGDPLLVRMGTHFAPLRAPCDVP
jgi:hypothetical protein